MKRTIISALALIAGLALAGCEETNTVFIDSSPATPQGVFSITGNEAVYLYWNGPYEADIEEYVIYRSFNSLTGYAEIGRVAALSNPNGDLIIYEYVDVTANNGTTYFYAVTSVDRAGQESELSAENVPDTPRPEGTVVLLDANIEPDDAGFIFASNATVAWNSPACDIWVDRFDGIFFINKGRIDTDFQDMGYRESLDGVDVAPPDGWAAGDFLELIAGHTYVIWTADGNYAKVHVEQVGTTAVTLSWAYQTDHDNPELVVPNERPITPHLSRTQTKAEYIAARAANHR